MGIKSEPKTVDSSETIQTPCYVINTYSISTKPLTNICKQPALWGDSCGKHGNTSVPLIYFQKPKWISEESFLKIIESIHLNLPRGFKAEHA